MVFSSLPIYLDPPHWQQQTNHHQPHQQHQQNQNGGSENPQLPPLPPPPPPPYVSSIRPGSMADRARMAKIPQPEAAQKCPRCESTNTKFCYFNNYSLSQPRHFCKTCRRYWTRGGALRNVPVGGGCRRNKKNKSNRSKSPVSTDRQTAGSNSAGAISSGCSTEMIGHHIPPFVDSLQNLSQYGGGNIGLNFNGISTQMGETSGSTNQIDLGFQIGNSGSLPTGLEQWRVPPPQLQQFPFFGGFETSTGLYPFQSEAANSSMVGENQLRTLRLSSRVNDMQAQVKTEDNQVLNLSSRPLFGISENSNQYWGGNMWPDLSGLNNNTSSTNHFL